MEWVASGEPNLFGIEANGFGRAPLVEIEAGGLGRTPLADCFGRVPLFEIADGIERALLYEIEAGHWSSTF